MNAQLSANVNHVQLSRKNDYVLLYTKQAMALFETTINIWILFYWKQRYVF